MRNTSAVGWLGTLAVLGCTACDSQLSPSYAGEPLLTIVGSVQITHEQRESLVVPALAFTVPGQNEVTIREVAVEGRFPADFRLDVYQPPPREAFLDATSQRSGEPRMAAAYVTAVAEHHADSVRAAMSTHVQAFGCIERTLSMDPERASIVRFALHVVVIAVDKCFGNGVRLEEFVHDVADDVEHAAPIESRVVASPCRISQVCDALG